MLKIEEKVVHIAQRNHKRGVKEKSVNREMDLWIEFYFALSEKWAVGVMGCRSNGLSE
jgi:hypothetical protein